MIARAPSTVSSLRPAGPRAPSISFTFHDCTGADSRRSRPVVLALLSEPRPKACNLLTRYGARDVGAQANRIPTRRASSLIRGALGGADVRRSS